MNKVKSKVLSLKNKVTTELLSTYLLILSQRDKVFCNDGISGAAKSSAEKITETLKNVADAFLPVMIIICGLSLIFTRDERKLAMEKKFLVGLVIAYALIKLSTVIFDTIKDNWIQEG